MTSTTASKMSFSQQIGLGFSTYGTAFGYLFGKGLWWAFIFPVFLLLGLFFAGFESIDFLTNLVKEYILQATTLENADFFGASVLKGITTGVIWILFKIFFFVIFSYFGGFIVLIILSPVLAFLSERTEKISSGHQYPFDIQQLMRDIVRGVLIAFRNMFIQIAFMLGLMMVSLIPVLGWIIGILSPLVMFLVTSYFYGFSFMDYNNERRKLNVSRSIRLMRKYKWVVVANGSVLAFVLIVPMCGMGTFICPFAAIVSVIAGSLAMENIFAFENNQNSNI